MTLNTAADDSQAAPPRRHCSVWTKGNLMQRRYTELFVKSAGAILLLTGAAKVLSRFGHAKILAVPDPILNLSFGNLMLAVGATELAIAGFCFLPSILRLPFSALRPQHFSAPVFRSPLTLHPSVSPLLQVGLVAWLAANFLAYRIGLWCVGWHHPCSCMGSLAGALHLSDTAADNIMKGVLAYLLVGSYAILFREWRWWRAAKTNSKSSPPSV